MQLTLAEAKTIADAAIRYARDRSAHVSVCVCDENGRFILINRMDGAVATTNRGSIGRALAAASAGRSSDIIPDPNDMTSNVGTVTGEGMPLIHRKGGLPIYRDGTPVGACGVCGAESDVVNEDCAQAGILDVGGLSSSDGDRP